MKYLVTLSALAATSLATVYEVTVGPDYVYSPDVINDAVAGDVVSFTFGQNHNVVSGSFDQPCQPSGGIYSGNPQNGDVFSITLNGTDPLWIYCSVPGHCQGGMAMVVNPPSGQTLDQYKSAAASVRGSSEPSAVEGGVFGAVTAAASSASSAASSSASGATVSASSAASSVSASVGSASASVASSVSSALSSASASAAGATSASGLAAATGVPAAMIAAAGLLALL